MARNVGQIPGNADPRTSIWFRSAKSPSGESCCDEADGFREGVAVRNAAKGEAAVIFRSWWISSKGYHLSLLDPPDLTPIELVWDGPVCAITQRQVLSFGSRGKTEFS
jgi:hypothetical protein